jgi:hypothetical protein
MLTLFHSLLDNHLHGNPCQKSSCQQLRVRLSENLKDLCSLESSISNAFRRLT